MDWSKYPEPVFTTSKTIQYERCIYNNIINLIQRLAVFKFTGNALKNKIEMEVDIYVLKA